MKSEGVNETVNEVLENYPFRSEMTTLQVNPVVQSGPSASAADQGESLEARELTLEEANFEGESVVVRCKRQPNEPTPEERANHCILHEQYRSWCRACVAGRGRLDAHTTRDGDKGVAGDRRRLWLLEP